MPTKLTLENLLDTGLFHRNYSVLDSEYIYSDYHSEGYDLILRGADHILLEASSNPYTTDEYCKKAWYILGPKHTKGFDSITFEQVLEIVSDEVRTQLLFYLDLFV